MKLTDNKDFCVYLEESRFMEMIERYSLLCYERGARILVVSYEKNINAICNKIAQGLEKCIIYDYDLNNKVFIINKGIIHVVPIEFPEKLSGMEYDRASIPDCMNTNQQTFILSKIRRRKTGYNQVIINGGIY